MTAKVTKISCPVYGYSEGVCMSLWQVDYTDHITPTDLWITFGIYEHENVANFVKEQIKNGTIKLMPTFLEGSSEVYKQLLG